MLRGLFDACRGQVRRSTAHLSNPNAKWAYYDKVLFESATIWRGENSNLNDVPEDDLQRLADYLHTSIVTKLDENYKQEQVPS